MDEITPEERRAALNELTRIASEDGSYGRVTGFVHTRPETDALDDLAWELGVLAAERPEVFEYLVNRIEDQEVFEDPAFVAGLRRTDVATLLRRKSRFVNSCSAL